MVLGLLLCGCTKNSVKADKIQETKSVETGCLIVTETISNTLSKSLTNHYEYYNLKPNDILYSGFATITVVNADKEKVSLITDNLIEPNADGTFNMFDKSLTEVTLKKGENIKLVTQTLESGATLILEYN